MKVRPCSDRLTSTNRDVRGGCFVCHGVLAHWWGGQAQGTAARHHDATGQETWCDVLMSVRYGRAADDGAQIDLEDAIASASSGGEPDATPLPDTDAPAVTAAGVSAPEGRSSRSALAAAKPEPTHA